MTMKALRIPRHEETISASLDEETENHLDNNPLKSYLTRNPNKVTAIVIAVLVASFIVATFLASEEPESPPLVEAPNFTLYDIDGNMFNLTDFRGTVVLLDFMTTWCDACNRSVVHINKLAEIYGDELVIISISVDPGFDTNEILRGYKLYHNSPWIHARDTAHVGVMYGVDGVPTFVLINRDGKIFDTRVGVIPHEILSSEIDILV